MFYRLWIDASQTLGHASTAMPSKTILKRRSKCHYHYAYLNIRNLSRIAICILLLTLIITISGQEEGAEGEGEGPGDGDGTGEGEAAGEGGEGEGTGDQAGESGAGDGSGSGEGGNQTNVGQDYRFDGHGTVHEQLGQAHYPLVELTPYKSKAVYTAEKNYSTWPIHPAYNFTHFIFDGVVNNKPALPTGYLVVKNESTLALGPKVEENDWSDLLAEYFLVIIWVLILLTLIILVPFLAVCYCCFCCCRRCKMGCPPCDAPKDKRLSLILSIVLLLLIVILIIGLLIAFFAGRFLDRGFDDTSTTMKRGSKDTCMFLQDVSDNVFHVFVSNYEELEAHMTEILNEAANHIFLDLADASESNAIAELERLLDNVKEARNLMKQVEEMQKDLLFNAAQLRDGMRGIKRDIVYTCTMLIKSSVCHHLLNTSQLQFIDSSVCLHLDKLPDPRIYTKAMEKILDDDVADIPKKALLRHKEIGTKIAVAMETVVPSMRMEISKGRDIFQAQASNVRNLIDAVISDIHHRTLESTQSFEDINDKYGHHRSGISLLACVLILLVLIILIFALILGVFINRNTGSHCLLIAIILMFCVFSFILLVSTFYFVIGLISYQGVCAPLRDRDDNAMFRELDSVLDLNKLVADAGATRDAQYSPMRMSNAIKACTENQSIFGLLRDNHLYDTEDLQSIKVMTDDENDDKKGQIFEDDLADVVLLTDDEKIALNDMRNGNLSSYHSILFMENMCRALTPDIKQLAASIRNISQHIYSDNMEWNNRDRVGRVSLRNEAMNLLLFDQKYSNVILNLMTKMEKNLLKIDELILFENRNFSNTIEVLVNAIVRSELFIKTKGNAFINSLADNLTDVLNDQIDTFVQGVIHNCNNNIGRCSPLAYIYYRGVDLICYRLVDPLNALWLGILICALVFIPIFFVCHRLICLWKRLHSYRVVAVPVVPIGGCPTCTGAPYVPPPIVTCTGGQQTFCVCSQSKLGRTDGGAAPSLSDFDEIADDDSLGQVTSVPSMSGLSQGAQNAKGMPPNPPKNNKSKKD